MIKKTRADLDYSIKRVLEKFLRNLPEGVDQELTRAIVDIPTLNSLATLEGDLFFKSGLREKDFVVLSIISWYLPEEIGWIINQSVNDKWTAQAYLPEKEILLAGKELMLSYLQIQDKFNDSDFFGNYLSIKNLQRIFLLLKLPRKNSQPVKKPVFRRGYNDKGSRRPDHQPEARFPEYSKLLTYRENRRRRMHLLIQKQRIRNIVYLNLRESS